MNDDQILMAGGTERDIEEYANANGANLTKEDFDNTTKTNNQER
jgi:hypothetical protein